MIQPNEPWVPANPELQSEWDACDSVLHALYAAGLAANLGALNSDDVAEYFDRAEVPEHVIAVTAYVIAVVSAGMLEAGLMPDPGPDPDESPGTTQNPEAP